jgi:hypothetical protein
MSARSGLALIPAALCCSISTIPGESYGRAARSSSPKQHMNARDSCPMWFFPTGIVNQGETLLVSYGAADTVTAVVELRMSDVCKGHKGQ